MNLPSDSYGMTRDRAPSVSYAEIETAARNLMAAGEYPSVAAVRQKLTRGSSTTIAEAMRRFWKEQAALSAGNPVALTRLPPEFADAAVALWEQALRLSLQTAKTEDNEARAKLENLKRDTESRTRSLELREREWDMAARIRERALVDAREQVNVLLKELANATAELRAKNSEISNLESQIEDHRRQLATVIARAISRNRTKPISRKSKPKAKPKAKKRPLVKRRSGRANRRR